MPRRQRPQPATDANDEFEEFDDPSPASAQSRDKSRQLLIDLAGRWYWIALGIVLGVLAGAYHHSKAPRLYRSTATVFIKQQASTVISRDQVDDMDMRTIEAMNTVAARIARPELLEKVAARPDVRAIPGLIPEPVEWLPEWSLAWFGRERDAEAASQSNVPAAPNLAGQISSWVNVSVRRGTRLLDITITHPTPEVAQAIANAICVEYVKERTSERSQGRSGSLQILIDESESARQRLQSAQNALAIYQSALGTLQELEAREANVLELSRRYLHKHPRMISANAELETAQSRFLSEFEAVRSSSADREYWQEHDAQRLADDNDEATRLLTARRLLIARSNVLQSEIQSQTSVFNSILTRIQESDINQQATESEIELSSLARIPGTPFTPVFQKSLAMGGAGGLAIGMLIAFIGIRIDNKFHTVAQVERETGFPVLAAVPKLDPAALATFVRKSKEKLPAESPPGREFRDRWQNTLLFHPGASSSTFAEAFRVLRASISLLGDEKKRRVNLISSALPGEGKTFTAANLALAAAQQGKKTLLIDCDLRKPAVHKIFGVKRDVKPGVTDVLSGKSNLKDAILTQTGAPNLHILLSGPDAPSPGELLESDALDNLLKQALDQYDILIVDSAPLLAVPDTRILAPRADNFTLVVRAGHTPRGAVLRTLEMLEFDGNSPDGLCVNSYSEKRRLIGQNYSYGNYQTSRHGRAYRYGYGYGYGAYGSSKDD